MDKEKQIEEMANIINEMDDCNAHYYDEYMIKCDAFADANAIAKVLYDAGYRKQSMGEWIKAPCSEKDGDAHCSICNHWDWSDCNYCSNCGAKMNSGEK